MCGITGVLDLHEKRPVNLDILERANNLLGHRGPDDNGIFMDAGIGLAMRRLSIIDVTHGHQPILNENSQICIVCNGEIYNHRELRESLVQQGHVFATFSDTEAILHAYEQWGIEGCLSRLRGMFAFALWDKGSDSLFLCRDRMGIKPLYFSYHDNRLYFASEMRGIFVLSGLKPKIDPAAVDAFLTVGFVPNPHTICRGVNKLPAAHYMAVRRGAAETRKYWELSFCEAREAKEQEITEEFYSILDESVRMHLMSEVPLGALLSGGIDSATMAALAQRAIPRPLTTISISFESDHLNEAAVARQTAIELGTRHVSVAFRSESMDDYPKALYYLEEPLAEPVFVTEFNMHKACKDNGLKVVLTGEGSDELLAGYHWHRGEVWARPFLKLPFFLRAVVARAVLVRSRGAGSMGMYRTLRQGEAEAPAYYRTWLAISESSLKERVMSQEVRSAIHGNGRALLNVWQDHLPVVADRPRHDQMLWLQSRTRMVDDINHSLDRMSMAHSVEARVPFLDHKLWEFCASVPFRMKMDGPYFNLVEKQLLRNAVRNVVPEGARTRRKKGLAAPYEAWLMKARLPDWAEEGLTRFRIQQTGLFDYNEVQKLRREHQEGLPDRAALLMAIIALQTWSDIFTR